ncbi:ZIP family metal transporter [Ammoniphilus resinae]|uniref:ZIP family zinc transporter n=1 Tax=Ammoniphilus resinae TaxID=861532 RepID=A0ABS4GVG0_9BACL|nr:ZIP family metal transporter [Ammoniphilus resinae]MBP1934012.1 ZIP family zinc transporter [Ammoniphilus resinae]
MELMILSLITGLTTMLGSVGVLFFGQPGKRILSFYLGLSAGIMVLLVLVDLLPAGFAQGPLEAVGIGMGLGILVMLLLHQFLHQVGGDSVISLTPQRREYYRMGLLISLAIALHNIPEGIAIGAGFETHEHLGLLMALSIALHNIPEGIGLAVPFVMAQLPKRTVIFASLAVSACIPMGALLGQWLFIGSPFMVTLGIGFACGAMGYIVWKEIAPTAIKYDRFFAQLGMGGSLVLMYLVHLLR